MAKGSTTSMTSTSSFIGSGIIGSPRKRFKDIFGTRAEYMQIIDEIKLIKDKREFKGKGLKKKIEEDFGFFFCDDNIKVNF
jgi:hypothetical protein